MQKYSFLLLLAMTFSLNNSFAYCENDFITNKSSDGSVLFLSSGTSWEVDSVDRVNSVLWLPSDDVILCDDSTIM